MGPSDDLKPAVMTLGDGRATLDPVAAIDVAKAVVVVHGCSVDVAADDTLGPMASTAFLTLSFAHLESDQ